MEECAASVLQLPNHQSNLEDDFHKAKLPFCEQHTPLGVVS